MDLAATVELFHHRWNVRVLAALHAEGGGTRLAVLAHRLPAHRETLRASIGAMERGGWIEPNPGYGHPLRPEFILTRRGRRLAPACAQYDRIAARFDDLDVAYRKWSAPVLVTLRGGVERFNAIQVALAEVTPRALAKSLKDLSACELIAREVADGYPPSVAYHLSRSGVRLADATRNIVSALSA